MNLFCFQVGSWGYGALKCSWAGCVFRERTEPPQCTKDDSKHWTCFQFRSCFCLATHKKISSAIATGFHSLKQNKSGKGRLRIQSSGGGIYVLTLVFIHPLWKRNLFLFNCFSCYRQWNILHFFNINLIIRVRERLGLYVWVGIFAQQLYKAGITEHTCDLV